MLHRNPLAPWLAAGKQDPAAGGLADAAGVPALAVSALSSQGTGDGGVGQLLSAGIGQHAVSVVAHADRVHILPCIDVERPEIADLLHLSDRLCQVLALASFTDGIRANSRRAVLSDPELLG